MSESVKHGTNGHVRIHETWFKWTMRCAVRILKDTVRTPIHPQHTCPHAACRAPNIGMCGRVPPSTPKEHTPSLHRDGGAGLEPHPSLALTPGQDSFEERDPHLCHCSRHIPPDYRCAVRTCKGAWKEEFAEEANSRAVRVHTERRC